jgi:predicted anti-sigma-YlaC factor YlaD
MSAYLDGELDEPAAAAVRDHLASCADCAELAAALELVVESAAVLATAEPPQHLADDLASSPCRRWLGLLFRAVDRDISDSNLARLLTHLEACEGCRRAWNDLTLIHQVSEAMEPPPHLLARCIDIRRVRRAQQVIGKRTVAAAAYVLAVLASLLVGNPASIARGQEAAEAVKRVAASVTNGMAEQGRGEMRVMLWRTWQWGARQAGAVRDTLHQLIDNDDSASTRDGSGSTKEETDDRTDQS